MYTVYTGVHISPTSYNNFRQVNYCTYQRVRGQPTPVFITYQKQRKYTLCSSLSQPMPGVILSTTLILEARWCLTK